MNKRIVAVLVAALATGLLVVQVVNKCGVAPADERAVIFALVEHWAEAAREGDIKTLRRALSTSYRDSEGRDRKTLDRYLMFQLLRRRKINALVLDKDATLTADERGADVTVKIALRRGTSVRALRLSLSLQKEEDGKWRVTAAQWRDIELDDLKP